MSDDEWKKNIGTLTDLMLSSYCEKISQREIMRWKFKLIQTKNEDEFEKIIDQFAAIVEVVVEVVVEVEEEKYDDEKEDHIAMKLVKYFSNKYNSGGQTHIIQRRAWQIEHILNGGKISAKDKMLLLTADCQSGKTFIVIAMALIYLSLGITPLLVVRNKKVDKDQLIVRLNRTVNEVLRNDDLGLKHKFREQLTNIIYVDGDSNEKDKEEQCEKMKKVLNGENNGIIISLANGIQLERIHQYVTSKTNMATFLDEADVEGGYGQPVDTIQPKAKFIRKLINKSKRYIAITATGQDILVCDHRLYSDNILLQKPGPSYRGFHDVIFDPIKNMVPIKKGENVTPKIIKKVIRKLTKKKYLNVRMISIQLLQYLGLLLLLTIISNTSKNLHAKQWVKNIVIGGQ